MPIAAVSATPASRREAARVAAHQYSLARAESRRDTRVAEAKAMAAARMTPTERAAQNPPRLPAMLIDLLV